MSDAAMEMVMQVKVWRSERSEQVLDATFPSYTKWSNEFSDTFNRMDEDGTVVSITRRALNYDMQYEIEVGKIDMTRPIDGRYFSGSGSKFVQECTANEFADMLDELAAVVDRARNRHE